jgi:O-antigen ligase
MSWTTEIPVIARVLMVAALFAYPALLVVMARAPGWALGVLLVASLATLPLAYARRAELFHAEDRGPVIGLALFLLVGTAGAIAWQAPTSFWVNYLRLFGVLAMIAAIRLLKPPAAAFYAGCAAGALAAGVFALWQCLWQGEPRAYGPEPPFGFHLATIFGGLSVLLGFLPILADPPGWRWPGKLLLLAGMMGGVTAAVLSGSRGAWLTCIVLSLWHVGRAKRWAALLLLFVIIGVSAISPVLAGRWDKALDDLLLYWGDHADTALGLRFEMWKAAAAAFASNPLFGIGPAGFNAWLIARSQAGLGLAALANFDHAHNEVLHAMATGGLIYLAGLVAAFWLPWRYFHRINATRNSPAARAGQALIVAFVVLGLSDALLPHRVAMTAYVVGIALMVGWAGARSLSDIGNRSEAGP